MKVATIVIVIITSLLSSDPLISRVLDHDRNLDSFRLSFLFLHLRSTLSCIWPVRRGEESIIKCLEGDFCDTLD